MKKLITLISTCVIFLTLGSCEEKPAKRLTPEQANSSTQTLSLSSGNTNKDQLATTDQWADTDRWVGEWRGPEGTLLKITGAAGKYELIIQDLDGPKSYSGVSIEKAIQFQRNDVLEKIRATNGEETGMKWLSEKQNCLTINRGEGFCRD